MAEQKLETERVDPAVLERDLDSKNSSKSIPDSPSGGIRPTPSDDRLFLSEEQALNRAKELPNDTEPIYLTYAQHDSDNPRNWPNWKRWYITSFASMLNVLTYASFPSLPRTSHH